MLDDSDGNNSIQIEDSNESLENNDLHEVNKNKRRAPLQTHSATNKSELKYNLLPKGTPYSRKEDEAMVNYVKQGTRFLDATKIMFWANAVNDGHFHGRSPASLHERYRKLCVKISSFDVDPKFASLVRQYATSSSAGRKKMREEILKEEKPDTRRRFTRKEDKAILAFINKDRDILRSNIKLWVLAEKMNICPGRSASSMMVRYRRLRNPARFDKCSKTDHTVYSEEDDSDKSTYVA